MTERIPVHIKIPTIYETPFDRVDFRVGIYLWCEEHVKKGHTVQYPHLAYGATQYTLCVVFDDAREAMMFKLKWA